MRYLLDTDTCIYLIKKKPPSVLQKLSELSTSDVALSMITLFELQYGVENSQHHKQSGKALNHFVESIQYILPMDRLATSYAAQVRADLKRKGTPIGPYDLLIAAVALSNNLTLVSNNTREFKRIEGLKLENWVSP
jgi:tRNA(fMet)-specific endonuclease VapC